MVLLISTYHNHITLATRKQFRVTKTFYVADVLATRFPQQAHFTDDKTEAQS